MAQFIELMVPGGLTEYLRCSLIERVRCAQNLQPTDVAPPTNPLTVILRDSGGELSVYGCTAIDILHAIHRDDCFIDFRGEEGPHG